jgi:hypothetical protein
MSSVISPDNGELYIKGQVNVANALDVGSDLSVAGNLEVTGNMTFSGHLNIANNGDIDLNNIPQDYASAIALADPAAMNLSGGAWIGKNLYIGGTLVANGDIVTLGNAGGSLTLNANIDSDVIPSTTETYDIGSETNLWRRIYTESLVLDTDPHTIEPTATEITSASSLCYFDLNSASSVALRDQFEGLVKTFTLLSTPAVAIVVTPDTSVGFTSFTLTNAGDSISLIYTSAGWVVTSVFRASVT